MAHMEQELESLVSFTSINLPDSIMKIAFYTTGITGSGHIVKGISIANALKRKSVDCEYTIMHSSGFLNLCEKLKVYNIKIQPESENELSKGNYKSSKLYKTITSINPDILIVDLFWFMIHGFINELECKKIFLCRQVADHFFTIPLKTGAISFRPEDYDEVIAIEPFSSKIPMRHINPMVIRNRDEILSRDEALKKLGLPKKGKKCLFAFNGKPEEYNQIKKQYSYLEDVGYNMVYSTNYEGGLFPAVDYFNAFDLIICGAGYNAFWEVMYFNKEAIFVPVKRRFESQRRRIEECSGYTFEENGADQLVDIILNL